MEKLFWALCLAIIAFLGGVLAAGNTYDAATKPSQQQCEKKKT